MLLEAISSLRRMWMWMDDTGKMGRRRKRGYTPLGDQPPVIASCLYFSYLNTHTHTIFRPVFMVI